MRERERETLGVSFRSITLALRGVRFGHVPTDKTLLTTDATTNKRQREEILNSSFLLRLLLLSFIDVADALELRRRRRGIVSDLSRNHLNDATCHDGGGSSVVHVKKKREWDLERCCRSNAYGGSTSLVVNADADANGGA